VRGNGRQVIITLPTIVAGSTIPIAGHFHPNLTHPLSANAGFLYSFVKTTFLFKLFFGQVKLLLDYRTKNRLSTIIVRK
jgi:hypothetical protein